jgi:hypothetical protein
MKSESENPRVKNNNQQYFLLILILKINIDQQLNNK